MRAVTVEDGKLAIREHPDPAPGNGELLVRRAPMRPGAGINRAPGPRRRRRRGRPPA